MAGFMREYQFGLCVEMFPAVWMTLVEENFGIGTTLTITTSKCYCGPDETLSSSEPVQIYIKDQIYETSSQFDEKYWMKDIIRCLVETVCVVVKLLLLWVVVGSDFVSGWFLLSKCWTQTVVLRGWKPIWPVSPDIF